MDGGWIADLMKRVVSLEDLEAEEEPEQSKAQRADEVNSHRRSLSLTLVQVSAALPEAPPKFQADEISNHFEMQRKVRRPALPQLTSSSLCSRAPSIPSGSAPSPSRRSATTAQVRPSINSATIVRDVRDAHLQ